MHTCRKQQQQQQEEEEEEQQQQRQQRTLKRMQHKTNRCVSVRFFAFFI